LTEPFWGVDTGDGEGDSDGNGIWRVNNKPCKCQ